ncbi:hypothetical protein GOBAR_DD36637 [Gossypium barbadense]|nr:hypothetical protein GOBAR_DD36637 [Gossypium barbadense]
MLSSGLYFKVVPLGDKMNHKIQEIKKFRKHGWDPLFDKVKLFCKNHEIKVPNVSAPYKVDREMNSHFNDEVVELLFLSSVLDPRDKYKTFWVEDICKAYE